jgi:hypothetical protein
MTSLTVVSLFKTRHQAESAVRDLKHAGFSDQQIGVAMQDPNGQRDLDNLTPGGDDSAARGAVDGGLVGGLIGLLGSLLIPGVGPVVLGGVLATALTGAGIGAVTGGLIGLLVGMGVSESDAERFDHGLRAGGILLTVNAGSRTPEAVAIIQQHRPDLRLEAGVLEQEEDIPERRKAGDPSYSGPERRLIAT